MWPKSLVEFDSRQKIIKRLILLAMIIGAILALFLYPLKTQALTFDYSMATFNQHKVQDPEPFDPCQILGGCAWEVDRYNQGTTLEKTAKILFDVIYFVIFIAGAIAVLMIVYGSVIFITAAENADRQKNAKNILFNAVIGLVLVILSFTIINVIQQIVLNLRI